jgi:hypothetical protein
MPTLKFLAVLICNSTITINYVFTKPPLIPPKDEETFSYIQKKLFGLKVTCRKILKFFIGPPSTVCMGEEVTSSRDPSYDWESRVTPPINQSKLIKL